ncbi:cation:proton antiporter [Marmoricola sp. URHB0036]|uniref:cation:proton antiporter n=1 Tax=Marmoricola sp. URHB0036 TaxID=1298863 RepID=UPI00040DA12B|nr:cation:proton antiporter [Marmoricola sp. URHB0036]
MITSADLTRVAIALLALLLVAHAGGALFQRFRQPRVIGEILGGLVLGPTVLGQVWPGAVAWMFTDDLTTRAVIGFVQQLGLFLLMFIAGVDARRRMRGTERRVIGAVSSVGLVVPFAFGLLAVALVPMDSLWGENANQTSFVLVFAIAVAVTSIPVISRIMHDLGLLRTGFARVVLGVAVVEDVILYVVLAVAVDLATPSGPATGLPGALGLQAGSTADILYHTLTTLGLLVLLFAFAPRVNQWIGAHPGVKGPLSTTSRRLIVLLAFVVGFLVLDLEAFLGAFVAGIFVGTPRRGSAGPDEVEERRSAAQDSIRRFAFAFFIPCYFALVGVNLNLAHGFEVGWFLVFLTGACLVKAASTYVGGRLAGLPDRPTRHLSVALNARGGPGIVLATVALGAGIVNEEFYIWLVLLAILTSVAAGIYLERVSIDDLDLTIAEHDQPDLATSAGRSAA